MSSKDVTYIILVICVIAALASAGAWHYKHLSGRTASMIAGAAAVVAVAGAFRCKIPGLDKLECDDDN